MSRYSDLRDALIAIQSQFESSVFRSFDLRHDLIMADNAMSDGAFASFTSADIRVDGVDWESWELWPSRIACGRFSGCSLVERWVPDFKGLAARAFLILNEIGELVHIEELIPQGFEFGEPTLRERDGSYSEHAAFLWLELLHEWGNRFPTTQLQVRLHYWNHPEPQPTRHEFEAVLDRTVTPVDGGAPYHPHPLCSSLNVDVFAGSAELIRLMVAPEEAVPIGTWNGEPEICLPEEPETPYWDGKCLWYGDSLVKQFKKPARNQTFLLNSFEEVGWPDAIQNPFSALKSREDPEQTLKDTTKDLNKDLQGTGSILRFGTEDNGQSVYWEPVNET